MDFNKNWPFLVFICLCGLTAGARQHATPNVADNTLFTAGHAGAFISGLYDAYYSYAELKKQGNFGLGAPDKLDGELMILDGKIYQTQSSGKTFEIKGGKTPFAVVNFFHADKIIKTSVSLTKDKLFAYLDSLLPNQQGIYAIHIKGSFKMIKTRAFPPVTKKPYVSLAAMSALQQFFTFDNINGDLIGYRLPAYMDGPNITGYHFHFLTNDKHGGGHVIDLLTQGIIVEIDQLTRFTVDIPQTVEFNGFDFKKNKS